MTDFSYHNYCTKCELFQTAITIGIGGNGSPNPDIMIIGTSPLKMDDEDGVAFHPNSNSGGQLRAICQSISEQTNLSFRYTSLVRCRVAKVAASHVKACKPYLDEEIDLTKPTVIVLAGAPALQAYFGKSAKITELRGNAMWRGNTVYVPMYHPSNMIESSGSKMEKAFSPAQYADWIMEDLSTAAKIATGEQTKPEEIKWDIIESPAEAAEVLYEVHQLNPEEDDLGVDIETNTYQDTAVPTIFHTGLEITHLGLSLKDNHSYVIPMQALPDHQPECAKFQPDFEWQESFINKIWEAAVGFMLQNGMYDFLATHIRYGTKFFRPYKDLILSHHLLWSHLRHALGQLARVHTPFGGYDEEVKNGVAAIHLKKDRGYHKLPFKVVARKNAYDASITRMLGRKFYVMVMADPQLAWLYNNITMPVTNPLMQMSMCGLHISPQDAEELRLDNSIVKWKIDQIMKEESPNWRKFEEEFTVKFNADKPIHRLGMLYHCEEGLVPTKLSELTGVPSTDKDVLEEASETSDIAYSVQKLKQLATIESKLLKPLPGWIGWDGRIHPNYKVYGTRTGRLASSEPNAQNLPRTSLWLFKSRPGRTLIVNDISAAEMRMLGMVAEEQFLIDAFNSGIGPDGLPLDIHAMVGAEFFNTSYDVVKEDGNERRDIKILGFGCIAEGQRVLTEHRGEVAIENISCYDRVWDGEKFVTHNGVVYRGYKKVITWDGLTATPDHKVWTTCTGKIRLSKAVAKKLRLTTTSSEGMPIRYSGGSVSRDTSKRAKEISSRMGTMHRMQRSTRSIRGQYIVREKFSLQAMLSGTFQEQECRQTSGAIRDDLPEMHQHKPSRLPQVWWSWNKMLIQKLFRIHNLYSGESSSRKLHETGYRQNKQQRKLRTWKSETSFKICGKPEQKKQCAGDIQRNSDYSSRSVVVYEDRFPRVLSVRSLHKKNGVTGNVVENYTENKTKRPVQETYAHVYDILNAGPNHRFTCEGKLVSNCVYGMTEHGVSKKIGSTLEYAADLIQRYYQMMPNIRINLFDKTKAELRKQGFVRSIFGRYWHLDDNQKAAFSRIEELIKKGQYVDKFGKKKDFWDDKVTAKALREAANFKIQSPTSDMVLLGLIKFEKMMQHNFKTYVNNPSDIDVYLFNEIHDAVVLEVKDELVDEVAPMLTECMENPDAPFTLPVKWLSDSKTGHSMYKKHLQKWEVAA